jgi:uncharacterized protein (DUF2236 family)
MTTLMNPRGVAWRVQRESVLLLGGRRALLMQIAHPLVAAAVADHSQFKQDPIGRLRRTLATMFSIAFGTVEQASSAYEQIDSVHARVNGRIPGFGDVPGMPTAATPYNARDPELLLWVHATLVDTSLLVHRYCVGDLGARDEERFYQESKAVARLFRIPDSLMPPGLREFRVYMREMIQGGPVRVSDTARDLARSILYPPVPLIPPPIFDAINFVTIGLLPPSLRDQYGLAWGSLDQLLFDISTFAISMALPIVPDFIRAVPAARAAERAFAAARPDRDRRRS